jgi:hypothetical protein
MPDVSPPAPRGAFILAGVAALLASVYWAALTLLIAFGAMTGSLSGMQAILPCVLVALYAYRGIQLFKGDTAAARRILWLHGIGAVVALIQLARDEGMVVLLGVKVAINVFGAITALLALRSEGREY